MGIGQIGPKLNNITMSGFDPWYCIEIQLVKYIIVIIQNNFKGQDRIRASGKIPKNTLMMHMTIYICAYVHTYMCKGSKPRQTNKQTMNEGSFLLNNIDVFLFAFKRWW